MSMLRITRSIWRRSRLVKPSPGFWVVLYLSILLAGGGMALWGAVETSYFRNILRQRVWQIPDTDVLLYPERANLIQYAVGVETEGSILSMTTDVYGENQDFAYVVLGHMDAVLSRLPHEVKADRADAFRDLVEDARGHGSDREYLFVDAGSLSRPDILFRLNGSAIREGVTLYWKLAYFPEFDISAFYHFTSNNNDFINEIMHKTALSLSDDE